MLTIIFMLFICQHFGESWSTRLPLEVYELQTAGGGSNHAAITESTLIQLNQNHKNLEYSTVHASQLNAPADAAKAASKDVLHSTKSTETILAPLDDVASTSSSSSTNANNLAIGDIQQDHRKSRQMYDIMQQQQQLQQQHHRFSHDAIMHGQRLSHDKENKKHLTHINAQDVRILYQVGVSSYFLLYNTGIFYIL